MNYVKGTVNEDVSGEPVKGAIVYLYEDFKKKEGHYLDSVLTDEKGEYHINFSKKPGKRYYVSCKCDKYFGSVTHFDKEIEHGRNAINFSISPYGYVKFRYIKNTNSANMFHGQIDSHFGHFHSPRTSNIYPDFIYDTYDISDSEPWPISGDRTHTVYWWISDYFAGSPSTSSYSSTYTFYVKKGDTLKYTFTFN